MPKSPRKESGSTAVKPKMSAAEALLKARETGEGPVGSVIFFITLFFIIIFFITFFF